LRHHCFLGLLFAFCMGCSGGDGEAEGTTDEGDTLSTGEGPLGTGSDTDLPGGTAGDLVGAWSRATPVAMGPDTLVNMDWVAEEDGSCMVNMYDETDFSFEFPCTYSATETGEFFTEDDHCTEGEGSYTYEIGADGVLKFTLVSDPCSDRSEGLASDWVRLD